MEVLNPTVYGSATEVIQFDAETENLRQSLLIDKGKNSENTLVQYSNPVEVGYERKDRSIRFRHAVKHSSGYGKEDLVTSASCIKDEKGMKGAGARKKVELLLEQVFPTLEWISDHRFWRQSISKKLVRPRIDDVRLDHDLLSALHIQGARLSFLCPIRRNIFDQCFDELLRRILLESPVRGLLLQQCRDGLRDALKLEMKLFYSHEGYNVRAGILSHRQRRAEKMEKLQENREKAKLVRKRDALMSKSAALNESIAMKRRDLDARYNRELEAIKADNQRLKNQILVFVDSQNILHMEEVEQRTFAEVQAAAAAPSFQSISSIASEVVNEWSE